MLGRMLVCSRQGKVSRRQGLQTIGGHNGRHRSVHPDCLQSLQVDCGLVYVFVAVLVHASSAHTPLLGFLMSIHDFQGLPTVPGLYCQPASVMYTLSDSRRACRKETHGHALRGVMSVKWQSY